MNLERTLIYQKMFFFIKKSALFHPIKLPFDAEAAERILKIIYLFIYLIIGLT